MNAIYALSALLTAALFAYLPYALVKPGPVGRYSRSLRVCIKDLRGKLEPDPRQPRYLITETGLGYRLRLAEESAAELVAGS